MLRQKTQRPQHKAAKKTAAKKVVHKAPKRKLTTKQLGAEKAPFKLTALPYADDALGKDYSQEAFSYHHGKHHNLYVNNLNGLVKDTPLAEQTLEQIIVHAHQNQKPGLFNNSAQHFNHAMFWHCMKVGGGGAPQGSLAKQIDADFGSFDEFKAKFKQTAVTHFGSGWAFLVVDPKTKKLALESHHDASTPFVNGTKPVMCVDVWEHAYYIDQRNNRAAFVDTFLEKLANWDYAQQNFDEAI